MKLHKIAMEVKVIHSMSFPDNICHSPAISWSIDNNVAVWTDECIYIMGLHSVPSDPSPNVVFQKTKISR